jgi:tetratricopeptide (TPR) repeat protein
MVKGALVCLGASVSLFMAEPAHAHKPEAHFSPLAAPTVTLDQPEGSSGTLDETALRYYASKRDLDRVEAEIRRLQALDPNWQPPKDLMNPKPVSTGVDETPIWELAAKGDIAAARAGLAEIKRKNPAWSATPELENHLAVNEARNELELAGATKNWSRIVEIASRRADLVSCANIDIMWQLAQAHGELGHRNDAFALYRTIVETCPNEKERQDTILKASAYVEDTQVDELLGLESARSSPSGKTALDQVRARLERGSFSRRLAESKGAKLSPERVKAFEEETRASKDSNGALTLGWFYHNENNHRDAEKWFTYANALNPDENSAEGLVYTYLALKDRQRAEEVAQPWLATSDRIKKALAVSKPPPAKTRQAAAKSRTSVQSARAVTPPIPGTMNDPEMPGAMDAAVAAQARGASSECLAHLNPVRGRSGWTSAMAQMRGWCLLSIKRETEAQMAFEEARALAVPTTSTGEKELESAQLGIIQSRLQSGMVEEAMRELATSNLNRAKVAELHADALSQQAVREYQAEHHWEALRLIEARNQYLPPRRDLEILRGYSLYHVNRTGEALALFEQLDKLLSTPESREGMRISRGGYD